MKAILKSFNPTFDIKVPGKWILAGEHTVLRGGKAIVFPLKSRFLELRYQKTEDEFSLNLKTENPELELIIWSVIEKATKKLNLKRSQLKGVLELDSKILFGAGMGASATLCVALTRWLGDLGYLPESQYYDFARDLENLFHGESSGLDVAVTLFEKPLLFSRHEGFKPLETHPKPGLYLSHTGVRGVTKDCIDVVKKLFVQDAARAEKIDEQMKKSVALFQELLKQDQVNSSAWKEALQMAHRCFYDWGLVNEAVKQHETELLRAGAEAVKLTGSGGGGFMLSYWTTPPGSRVTFEMIPCFNETLV